MSNTFRLIFIFLLWVLLFVIVATPVPGRAGEGPSVPVTWYSNGDANEKQAQEVADSISKNTAKDDNDFDTRREKIREEINKALIPATRIAD